MPRKTPARSTPSTDGWSKHLQLRLIRLAPSASDFSEAWHCDVVACKRLELADPEAQALRVAPLAPDAPR
jgi:hypothetical protein